MKIITYLGFTFLSIVIQFCVMDFIQEKKSLDGNISLNLTSQKRSLSDLLRDFKHKPHALYYHTQIDKILNKNAPLSEKSYGNSSLATALETSTTASTAVFDLLYDEDNMSSTESAFTTELLSTSTELDNVTELIFFNKQNDTNITPQAKEKKSFHKDKICNCNLLYNICDINCCCDVDCSEAERKMFVNCFEYTMNYAQKEYSCYPHTCTSHSSSNGLPLDSVDNMFCIVKTNLPKKRNVNYRKNGTTNKTLSKYNYFNWHNHIEEKKIKEFTKTPYVYGDSLWVMRNGSFYYIDLPSSAINNYCTGRTLIKFLKDDKINCNVKLKDLEMFQVLRNSEETIIISVIDKSWNGTALNDSTLHCTNWNIIACDEKACVSYNKSLHEPSCTESVCTNLALKLEYIFYYHDFKIINATIKLYIQKMSIIVPLMTQEIDIKFYLANTSIDDIVEFSGNPGYMSGFPVVVSYTEKNHTDNFFNNTIKKSKYFKLPNNRNGKCIMSNVTSDYVEFGLNKRIKCRYYHTHNVSLQNDINICQNLQNTLLEFLGLKKMVTISPFGNPYDIKDEGWIPLQINFAAPVFGEYDIKLTKLKCNNLITRFSLVFAFVDISDVSNEVENKIVDAKIDIGMRNVTFNIDEFSFVITIDNNFIDITEPPVYEYAGGPNVHVILPKDFFFPFSSNETHQTYGLSILLFYTSVIAFIMK